MSNIRKKIAACLAVVLVFSVTGCENLNKTVQNDGKQIEVTKHIELSQYRNMRENPMSRFMITNRILRRQNLMKMCLSPTANWMQKADVGVAEA